MPVTSPRTEYGSVRWMARRADMGGVRGPFPASLRRVRGLPERHVPIACDTIRLVVGRPGPVASSLAGLSKDDIARIQSAANVTAGEDSEVAGIGFELQSGLRVILRRMPPGQEVRGLITRQDYAATDAIRLLGNHPFWASSDFTARRQARAPLEPGHSPARWAHGLAVLPKGFVQLAGGDPPASESPAPRSTRIQRRHAAKPLASATSEALGDPSALRDPAPPWVLHACVAATATSVVFLATTIVLSQLGRPPEVPPTPLAPPLTTPSP
jgi:hypothetical protein